MDIKKIFGAILTLAGIAGLVYTAIEFVNSSGGTHDFKALFVIGLLGIVFFGAGISLVRSTSTAPGE